MWIDWEAYLRRCQLLRGEDEWLEFWLNKSNEGLGTEEKNVSNFKLTVTVSATNPELCECPKTGWWCSFLNKDWGWCSILETHLDKNEDRKFKRDHHCLEAERENYAKKVVSDV